MRLAIDLNGIRAPAIQDSTATVSLQAAGRAQVRAGLGRTGHDRGLRHAAVARHAATAASSRSGAAAAFDDAAAAIGDRSAFAGIALRLATAATIRLDAQTSAAAIQVGVAVGAPAAGRLGCLGRVVVDDLRATRAGDGQPREQSQCSASEAQTRSHHEQLPVVGRGNSSGRRCRHPDQPPTTDKPSLD